MDAAPPPAPPQPAPVATAWPRAAQLAAALLLGAALTLLGTHAWGYLRYGTRPTDLNASHRIDLNRADRAELLQLPGIGPKLAESIEADRREHGPFRSVDDLARVKGIGPATLARLRSWLCVEGADDEPDADTPRTVRVTTGTAKQAAPRGAGKKGENLSELIDINTATAAELRQLPGVGPKLSQVIVDERDRAPFKSVDDLRRVHGIGAKTLERLRPHVTVGGESRRVAASE
jgi:competence protein ComEA